MRVVLTAEEVRVLGSLVEKSVTTPEYYPLSLVSVTAACNQKSSRDPVVAYDAPLVEAALQGLRDKHLLWVVSSPEGRVPKYKHRFREAFDLSEAEQAVLCLLMLRGPQTPGELKSRAERLFAFGSPEEVEAVLRELAAREEGPLALSLPRKPGQKEVRWIHTLSGVPVEEPASGEATAGEAPPPSLLERLRLLEEEVRSLRSRVEALEAFRKGLEEP
jgi:hypothetical protein